MRKNQFRTSIAQVALMLGLCLSASGQHQLSGGGSDEIAPLTVGSEIEREIVPMQKHRYAIKLNAGEYVRVAIEEVGVDAVMSLRSPDEINLLDYAQVKPVNGIKTIWAGVSAAGTYELRVISYGQKDGKGTYRVKIGEIRPATSEEINYTAGMKLYNEAFNAVNTFLLTREAIDAKIANGQKALEHFRAAKAVKDQARTLWQMGVVSTRLGVGPHTLKYYQESLALSRTIDDRPGEANTLRDLGDAYEKIGDWDQAFRHLSAALDMARETKREITEADVLNQFGEAYSRFGDLERATLYLQQSASIYLKFSNVSRSKPLNNLGKVALESGEAAKAEDFFRQAVETVRNENYRFGATKGHESLYLNNLARTQYVQGKIDQAVATLNDSLRVSSQCGNIADKASALRFLGRIFLDSGEPSRSRESLQQALELFRGLEDRQNTAQTLLLIARAKARTDEHDGARTDAEQAIALIEQARTGVQHADLRDSFSADLQDFYGFYVDLLMQHHKRDPKAGFAALALEANERGRARGLIDMLAESKANIREGISASLLQREVDQKTLLSARRENLMRALLGKIKPEEVAKLKAELEQIRTGHEQTQAEIRRSSPRYSALTQPQPLKASEIRSQVVDEDSVLLEYALGEQQSHLWVVTKDSVRAIELPDRRTIENTSRLFYDSLTARHRDVKFETADEREDRIRAADSAFVDHTRELSRMIIGPALPLLANKRLLIVGDGILQSIPFAALAVPAVPDTRPEKGPAGGLRYLIETNEIVTLPSATVLSVLRKETANRRMPAKTLAIFADPVFESGDDRVQEVAGRARSKDHVDLVSVSNRTRSAGDIFSRNGLDLARLPYTRREAELISSLVPARQQQKLLDFAASRRSAMSSELSAYRYIHFATHGSINNAYPELSGIVLSMFNESGAEQDGFLRVGDIYSLKLPAEMVVLSGCRTGLGKEIKGEGLMGLTRGFIYSGARRVTVSLWDVNDRATADLMGHFYRKMLGDERLQPAAALRQAQITMLKDKHWENPYYWAAFVLAGEPK